MNCTTALMRELMSSARKSGAVCASDAGGSLDSRSRCAAPATAMPVAATVSSR